MTEKLALSATAAATGVAGYGWIDQANDLATLGVTVMALLGAVAAALYHYERWRKLRNERNKEKDDAR
jgi:hypothetical protein